MISRDTSDNVEKIDNCGKNDGNDSSENNGRSHTHTHKFKIYRLRE